MFFNKISLSIQRYSTKNYKYWYNNFYRTRKRKGTLTSSRVVIHKLFKPCTYAQVGIYSNAWISLTWMASMMVLLLKEPTRSKFMVQFTWCYFWNILAWWSSLTTQAWVWNKVTFKEWASVVHLDRVWISVRGPFPGGCPGHELIWSHLLHPKSPFLQSINPTTLPPMVVHLHCQPD